MVNRHRRNHHIHNHHVSLACHGRCYGPVAYVLSRSLYDGVMQVPCPPHMTSIHVTTACNRRLSSCSVCCRRSSALRWSTPWPGSQWGRRRGRSTRRSSSRRCASRICSGKLCDRQSPLISSNLIECASRFCSGATTFGSTAVILTYTHLTCARISSNPLECLGSTAVITCISIICHSSGVATIVSVLFVLLSILFCGLATHAYPPHAGSPLISSDLTTDLSSTCPLCTIAARGSAAAAAAAVVARAAAGGLGRSTFRFYST